MVRVAGDNKGPFGAMLSNLIADVVVKVIAGATSHQNEARVRTNHDLLEDAGQKFHHAVRPMAQHCLDTGAVHPLLEPVFRLIAKGE